MFQFQTQATRDASGADIRGGLRQGPLRVNRVGCARTSRFRSAPQIGPRVSRSGLRLRVISRLMHRSKWRLRGRDASYLAFPAQICERLGVIISWVDSASRDDRGSRRDSGITLNGRRSARCQLQTSRGTDFRRQQVSASLIPADGARSRTTISKDPRAERVSCLPLPETSHPCRNRSPLPCAILCRL